MKHTDLMMRLSTKASHGPCLPPNLMSSLQTIQGKMNKLNDTMKESESVSCSVTSDSLRPHGLQPARFLCPWDSPSKNTGVGCHFLLQGIFLTQRLNLGYLCLLHWQADSLSPYHLGSPIFPHGRQPTRLLCPWDSPGKNTGVGSLSLLQGIFPTQGPNLALLCGRQILYRLSHQFLWLLNFVS